MDPLGSYGRLGSEGSDGQVSLGCSCGARQAPAALGSGGQGLGCGRAGEGEQARARAAGTGALAPEQRGAAPRIPRIPARPRLRRHVVVLRAALTVRLGEGAHRGSGGARTSQGAERGRQVRPRLLSGLLPRYRQGFCSVLFSRNESCACSVMAYSFFVKTGRKGGQAPLRSVVGLTVHLRNVTEPDR